VALPQVEAWLKRLEALEPADGILTDEIIAGSDWPAATAVAPGSGMSAEELIDSRFSAKVEARAYLRVVLEAKTDMIGAKCWQLEKSRSDADELARQLAHERYWKSVARWVSRVEV
jgi:hypothetical protein